MARYFVIIRSIIIPKFIALRTKSDLQVSFIILCSDRDINISRDYPTEIYHNAGNDASLGLFVRFLIWKVTTKIMIQIFLTGSRYLISMGTLQQESTLDRQESQPFIVFKYENTKEVRKKIYRYSTRRTRQDNATLKEKLKCL